MKSNILVVLTWLPCSIHDVGYMVFTELWDVAVFPGMFSHCHVLVFHSFHFCTLYLHLYLHLCLYLYLKCMLQSAKPGSRPSLAAKQM